MSTPSVYLMIMTSVFFWGTNFVLAAPILAEISPEWAAALRFWCGAALMLSIALIQRERLWQLLRQHAPVYLLAALLGITAFNLLFFHALRATSADNAALIMATNPLLTALLASVILGERPGARHLIALPIALLGVVVVITQGSVSALLSLHVAQGDWLMLGANLSWAFYNIVVRRYMSSTSALGNTAWTMVMGALLLTAVALSGNAPFQLLSMHASLALLVMAVGGTVLAYLFWSVGIKHLGAARTSIFLNLVPVSAMLASAFVGILPTLAQVVGGLLVMSAVTLSMAPRFSLARQARGSG